MALTGLFLYPARASARKAERGFREKPVQNQKAGTGNRHAPVKWHAYCFGSETETTMLRDCPTDAKATLALIAVSALCILGWLADLGL
jgi:hypothetical protein